MDTGKNELSPEMVEALQRSIMDIYLNQHPILAMLTAEEIAEQERLRLSASPVKEVLGHCVRTEASKNGLTFKINLTDKGRKVVDDITTAEQLYWNIYDARHSKEENNE